MNSTYGYSFQAIIDSIINFIIKIKIYSNRFFFWCWYKKLNNLSHQFLYDTELCLERLSLRRGAYSWGL